MGIIRALKSSELGGEGDEPIYPVTSVRAIYDLNNKALDAIIEEQNTSISNTSTKASLLEKTINKVNINIDSIKSVQSSLQGNINTIQSNVQTLESAVAQKNNQNNYIVAKVTADNSVNSVTRGLPETVNNNLEYCPVKESMCVSSEFATSYIQNIKDGEILIPTKPGTYILNNKEIEVIDYSLIQKQGEDFVVISLGIPMPPCTADGNIEPGKVLTTSNNGLYWS